MKSWRNHDKPMSQRQRLITAIRVSQAARTKTAKPITLSSGYYTVQGRSIQEPAEALSLETLAHALSLAHRSKQ